MNLLNTIIHTHFELTKHFKEAHHCIQSDITRWGRSSMTAINPKYHLLEPIITQSFTLHILALFYSALCKRNYVSDQESYEKPKALDKIIQQLSFTQYIQLMKDVQRVFTLNA